MKRSTQVSFVDNTAHGLVSSFRRWQCGPSVALWVVIGSTALAAPAYAEQILGLVPSPQNAVADQSMQHVAERLGEQLVVATTTAGASHDALTSYASDAAFIIAMDPNRGDVAALRSSDGTFLIRRLQPEAWNSSPFSASLVALELLELARGAPAVAPEPVEPVVRQPIKPKPVTTASSSWSLRFALEAGGAVDWSAGNETTLARPYVATDLSLVLNPIDLALQLRAAGFGQKRQTLTQGDITYQRHDLDVGLGIGRTLNNYWLGASLRLGLSIVDVNLEADPEPVEDRRYVLWSGLSLAARRTLWAGFSVGLTADVAWVPQPPRFLVQSTPVLSERGFRLRVALGLRWSTP